MARLRPVTVILLFLVFLFLGLGGMRASLAAERAECGEGGAAFGSHDRHFWAEMSAYLTAQSVRLRTVPYVPGNFDCRWMRLRAEAQRRARNTYDTTYGASQEASSPAGSMENGWLAGLDKRLRLAVDLTRRLADDGFDQIIPRHGCVSETMTTPLAYRACALVYALLPDEAGATAIYQEGIERFAGDGAIRVDYGLFLHRMGHYASARDALARAVDLADTGTLRLRAQSLHMLGNVLADEGNTQGAADAYRSALALWRAISVRNSGSDWIDLATTLNNYHTVLLDLGKIGEADATLNEALALRYALARSRPALYASNLGVSLTNIAYKYQRQAWSEDAAQAYGMSATIYRRLLSSGATYLRRELANVLRSAAHEYYAVGLHHKAAAAIAESIGLLSILIAEGLPYHSDKAEGFLLQAAIAADRGQEDLALDAGNNGIAALRLLAIRRPEEFSGRLADALRAMGMIMAEIGRGDAAPMFIEALQIRGSGGQR